MLTFTLYILALITVAVGIFTNTELMAAGIIGTVITFTALAMGRMNARSNA